MKVEARIKPTEDSDKLKKAIFKILPSAELSMDSDEESLTGEANFEELWEDIKRRKVRISILEILEENMNGDETHLDVSKTSASAGKVSAYVGSSIGKIRVHITQGELEGTLEDEMKKELNTLNS